MYLVKRAASVLMVSILALLTLPIANGQAVNESIKPNDRFDPIEFIKLFKVGMSYTEVQKALPKDAEQDILSYLATDDLFLLTVDLPDHPSWSASFKFDTLDTPLRRPEQLVEMSCSATVSSRSQTFESIVNKVTAVFGEPAQLDRSPKEIRQAGWRVLGGSVLTLEYSIVPSGLAGKDVSVDFIIKKNKRSRHDGPRDVA
ncbi:MAG TPA: hypothetical protein VE262_10705 [Blastocatellia bacterium]|nr:hypothetical protein [Blastocatellia bacterium]